MRPAKQELDERLSQPSAPASHSACGSNRTRLASLPTARLGGSSPNGAAPALIRSTSDAQLEDARDDELGVEGREGGLEPGHPHRRLLERHLLLVDGVRRVIGRDAVDDAGANAVDRAPGDRPRREAAGSS